MVLNGIFSSAFADFEIDLQFGKQCYDLNIGYDFIR